MPHDFFDPTPEQQNVVLIDAATLREAECLVESCQHCNAVGAEIPFDWILDRVMLLQRSAHRLEPSLERLLHMAGTFHQRRHPPEFPCSGCTHQGNERGCEN